MAHIGSQSRVVGASSDGPRCHSTELQVHNRRVPELCSSPIRFLPRYLDGHGREIFFAGLDDVYVTHALTCR
eukprot:6069944-Prymnesium_polylepis.1